jgi:hypothetical protein
MPGFTIPNTPDAANQNQAEPDSLDFQILGNQKNGIVNGMTVTPGSGQTVAVASGEVLINGIHYTFGGSSVTLTSYVSTNFFDVIYARVSGGAVTCYAIPGVGGIGNPRYPSTGPGSSQINLDTDVVLASVWRTVSTSPSANEITDKRIFVRSNASRINADTLTQNRGSTGDTFVNGSWSPSSNLVSPLSVKVGSTWYNLARYSENFSAGTITANLVGNVTGNVTGTAGSVAWANVSGKPAIGDVFNNGGTYSINITGSAGYANGAGYANSAGSAGSASSANYANSAGSAGSAGVAERLQIGGAQFGIDANNSWGTATSNMHTVGTLTAAAVSTPTIVNYTQETGAGTPLILVNNGTIRKQGSKRELKNSIEDVETGLNTILQLRPRYFKWNERADDNQLTKDLRETHRDIGFIVEEVNDVSPELAFQDKNKLGELVPTMWKNDAVVALLVKAVQELSAKVEALEAQ